MQGDPGFFTGHGGSGSGSGSGADYQLGGYNAGAGCYANNGNYGGHGVRNGFDLKASESCPKTYVIFDQTKDASRIVFSQAGETPKIDIDDRYISSSSFKEDSVEIDALLSMDDDVDEYDGDDDDDDDDDVMSTGRTPGSYNSCSSLDSSCSTLVTRCGPSCDRKKARVKKMVKALRGIVPGGEQMETPVFLDEAVKYLKSLKMEVSQLGIQNSIN